MGDERKRGGFASMTPEMRREIARKGGVAAHASGKAHHFTHEKAVEAGRKGAEALRAKREAAKESAP